MKTPYYPLFHILKWLCRQEQIDEIEQAKVLVYNKIVQNIKGKTKKEVHLQT
jgi:hypothetical protein